VVEASSVLSTHLTETIKRHADELLTRKEVDRLMDTLKERSPRMIEELIPQVVKPGEIQKVLQALLRERVPIRDLEAIVETIGDWAPRTKDPDILVEYVRAALGRTICQQYRGPEGKIGCITLDPGIEEAIVAHLEQTERGTLSALPPDVQRKIVEAITSEVERVTPSMKGQTPVILASPRIRSSIRRMVEPAMPHVGVLSFNEIVRGVQVESLGLVTLRNETGNDSG
jgi:flagellar biosynthesis protein FlhA